MAEYIPVPLNVFNDTITALAAALRVSKPERDEGDLLEVYGQIFRAKESLEKAIPKDNDCDTVRRRGYLLLRRLDEVKREIKREFGLEEHV